MITFLPKPVAVQRLSAALDDGGAAIRRGYRQLVETGFDELGDQGARQRLWADTRRDPRLGELDVRLSPRAGCARAAGCSHRS